MATLALDLLTAGVTAYRQTIEARPRQELTREDILLAARECIRLATITQELCLSSAKELRQPIPSRLAERMAQAPMTAIKATLAGLTTTIELLASASERWPDELFAKELHNSRTLLANLDLFLEELNGIVELLSRPPEPMSAELRTMCDASRASFLHGGGKTYDDWLRERGRRS